MLQRFLKRVNKNTSVRCRWEAVAENKHIRHPNGETIVERRFVICDAFLMLNGVEQASGGLFIQAENDSDENLFNEFNSFLRSSATDPLVKREVRPRLYSDPVVMVAPSGPEFFWFEDRVLGCISSKKQFRQHAIAFRSRRCPPLPHHADFVFYAEQAWSLHADISMADVTKILEREIAREADQLASLVVNTVVKSNRRDRISETVRSEVWRRDGGKCLRCGSRIRLEFDHIVPVSLGGSDTARNIELLCEACNRSKGARI